MKKIIKYLSPVLPLLLAMGIMIITTFWVILIYALVKGFQMASQGTFDANKLQDLINTAQTSEFLLLVSVLFALIDIVVFSIWLHKIKNKGEEPAATRRFSVKNALILIVLGLCLQIALSILLTVISNLRPDWFKGYGELMDQLGMGNTPLSFLYVGIMGPIAEELIFRGLVLSKARKVMPFMAANLFQAVLFGIYHMNLIQGLYAFAIGLGFGLVRYSLDSIAASILLHMSVNLSGMLLGYILTDEMMSSPIISGIIFLVTLAVIIITVLYFVRVLRKRKEETQPVYTFDEN